MTHFTTFTRRTDDPKLSYIERLLDEAGIDHYRSGFSFHAPILEIDASREDEAWAILTPIDDIPDDDPQFQEELAWEDYTCDQCVAVMVNGVFCHEHGCPNNKL